MEEEPPAPITVDQIVELYDDAERCATAAGLRYVSPDEPGIRRVRRGKGFSYVGSDRKAVTAEVRARIQSLAIPPAWRDVWICLYEDGHLLAIGNDERGRRQYRYHDNWRTFRDLLNFYRLVDFGPRLPAIRADVATQLRRRTFDRELVLATMIRVVDACGLRVGSEIYAEENDSYGLSTLTKKHVRVRGATVDFGFPAKSGKQAMVSLPDRAVARVISKLLEQRGRRLFAIGGEPIGADGLNDRLSELAGARVTAKDFRTWHGTRVAFASLRKHLPPPEVKSEAEQRVLNAVDAASEFLSNTRTVARAHYVHPHVLESYLDGTFVDILKQRRPIRAPMLDDDERTLLPFLDTLLVQHVQGFGNVPPAPEGSPGAERS
jgi:DNA topoisomerase-1